MGDRGGGEKGRGGFGRGFGDRGRGDGKGKGKGKGGKGGGDRGRRGAKVRLPPELREPVHPALSPHLCIPR